MWKMSKCLTACVLAAVWWGIFYPELCFSEGTCAVVRTENAQEEAEEIDAAAVWRASGNEIVIRSRFWEWCVENLFDAPENAEKSVPENSAESTSAREVTMSGQEEWHNSPIGVFDSGVGGLTVAREIMRQLPNERIVYFGDTARVPYGNKSRETVTKFSKQIVRFLETQQIKAIVVACNTASAYALEELEKEVDLPMIGVVKPGVRAALEATKNKKIGVVATEATIHSGIYSRYIEKDDRDVKVLGKACPLFVPLVEEGLWEDPVTDEIAHRYLSELIDSDIDTLILGCTHYPMLRSTVAKIMGEGVTLVNPAYETARELKLLLAEKGLESEHRPGLGTELYRFYVSDGAEKFKQFANSILNYGILSAKVVNIEEY